MSTPMVVAPKLRRGVAAGIDLGVFYGVALGSLPSVAGVLHGGLASLAVAGALPFAAQGVVYAVFRGQTLGKLLTRLKVVRGDGGEPSFVGGYVLREALRVVLGFCFGVVLTFLRDERGRYPHESVTDTWVVRL